MRERIGRYRLRQAADDLFLVASPAGDPETLDIAAVPALLRRRLDIRIANHDGGQTVLSKFSEAGALPQVNLTLMRGMAVRDVLGADPRLDERVRSSMLSEFDTRRQLFFSGDHRLPDALHPVSVLTDDGDGVVVSFDARALRGL
jgi:D-alanyl-D-alanine carboxypeptidase